MQFCTTKDKSSNLKLLFLLQQEPVAMKSNSNCFTQQYFNDAPARPNRTKKQGVTQHIDHIVNEKTKCQHKQCKTQI